jgi:hypothetical protein
LIGDARIWYDGIILPQTWVLLEREFKIKFSRHGTNVMQVSERWQKMTFDPKTTSISRYIQDIKEMAEQIGAPDQQVVIRILTNMPAEVRRSLQIRGPMDAQFLYQLLPQLFVEPEKDATASKSHSTPTMFSAMQEGPKTAKRDPKDDSYQTYRLGDIVYNSLHNMTQAMDRMTDTHKKQQMPFKPRITQPGRGRGRFQYEGRGRDTSYRGDPRGRYNSYSGP